MKARPYDANRWAVSRSLDYSLLTAIEDEPSQSERGSVEFNIQSSMLNVGDELQP
jgi:hypothetical protein